MNPIRNLFTNIAPQYDGMNRMLSLGLDVLWRKRILKRVEKNIPRKTRLEILDIAAGTGDFAIALAKFFPEAKITAVDLTPAMMEIGKEKVKRERLEDRIEFTEGDVNALPFENGRFDLATCAFGFRNFPSAPKALSETARVLKDDGHLAVLEFFRPRTSFSKAVLNSWLAFISHIFARRSLKEYKYLRQSISHTHRREDFILYASEASFGLKSEKTFMPYCSALVFGK